MQVAGRNGRAADGGTRTGRKGTPGIDARNWRPQEHEVGTGMGGVSRLMDPFPSLHRR